MNTDLLITPEDAKTFARKLFIAYHPEHELWFDVAWEVLEETGAENITTSVNKQIAGLAAAGDSSSELLTMADDFAMFFEMFMLKSPVLGTSLAGRIQKIAKQRSGESFDRTILLKRFNSVLGETDIASEDKNKYHELGEIIKEQFSVTQEIIRQEHNETRKTVRKPVISSKYKTNYLITLRASSHEVIINTGFQEHTLKLSRVKFELLSAIGQLHRPVEKRSWIGWEEITRTVPLWSNKDDSYVRHRIAELKDEFKNEFVNLIESKQGYGYRLSTHPENIFEEKT
jgi:hypothetical protein